MIFTRKSGYSLRALIKLAQNYGQEPYSLRELSQDEGISFRYLEKLFRDLKQAGLVKSEKGVSGGYSLAKKPKEITVYDIIKASDWKKPMFYCVDTKGLMSCPRKECMSRTVWMKINKELVNSLKKIKLSEVIK